MADNEPLDTLAPRQSNALEALLVAGSIGKAAAACDVPERTLRHWLRNDPAFIEAYRTARREGVQQAIARLQSASGSAVDVLLSLMKSTKAAPATRLAAAAKVLELAHKGVELDDVIARLEALEAAREPKP